MPMCVGKGHGKSAGGLGLVLVGDVDILILEPHEMFAAVIAWQQLHTVCVVAAVVVLGQFAVGERAAYEHLGIVLEAVVGLIVYLVYHRVVEYCCP